MGHRPSSRPRDGRECGGRYPFATADARSRWEDRVRRRARGGRDSSPLRNRAQHVPTYGRAREGWERREALRGTHTHTHVCRPARRRRRSRPVQLHQSLNRAAAPRGAPACSRACAPTRPPCSR
eukprot:scaffold182_cov350-Prasinococcus_capsulatus_cf.AAC.5